MTYDYVLEKRDMSRIDKLNALKDSNTFWNDVRKLCKNITSDHGIHRWRHLAEVRYNELIEEA